MITIIELGIHLKKPNVCLVCEALFKASEELRQVLPFGKKDEGRSINTFFEGKKIADYLILAKRDYE